MVDYYHERDDDSRLRVEGSETAGYVMFTAARVSAPPDDERSIDIFLGRGAVAALVGQLQSWLSRTGATAGPG